MSDISRAASFGKLNAVAYKAIEGATVLCKMRGNAYVELQHWLMQIFSAADASFRLHGGLPAAFLPALNAS